MNFKFSDIVAFATIMTMRDISQQKESELNATYLECYSKIADDSGDLFRLVTSIVKEASPRYIPKEILSGGLYLPLYVFSLVIKEQTRVTYEQRQMLDIYFNTMSFPFSQSEYLDMIYYGNKVGDFHKLMSISQEHAGDFWINLFRALYTSGTQKNLQEIVDYVTSIIMRFSILGNQNGTFAEDICKEFVESINYQINHMDEISPEETDWFGIIDTKERMENIRKTFKSLINLSQITKTLSEEELEAMLEVSILNCLYEIIKEFESQELVQTQMLNDAVEKVRIKDGFNPEQFIKDVIHNDDTRQYYNILYSVQPLGDFWKIILKMGIESDRLDLVLGITRNMISIFVQVENALSKKYVLSTNRNVARDYMYNLLDQFSIVVSQM